MKQYHGEVGVTQACVCLMSGMHVRHVNLSTHWCNARRNLQIQPLQQFLQYAQVLVELTVVVSCMSSYGHVVLPIRP